MHLFQSEWLREPARPAAPSYARPTYGTRYARADAPVDVATVELPPPLPASGPTRTPSPPRFDRAA